MIPEERDYYGGGGYPYLERFWCDICCTADTFEHEVIVERDMSGALNLSYCAYSGKVLNEPLGDITQAELDYVKQSLGVVNG